MSLSGGETTEQRIAREGRERAEAERRANEAAQLAAAERMAHMFAGNMPGWKLHGDQSDRVVQPVIQAGEEIKIKKDPGIYHTDDGKSIRIMLMSDGKIGFPDSDAMKDPHKAYGDAIDFIKRGQGCDKILVHNPPGEPLDLKKIIGLLEAAKERRVAVRFDAALEQRLQNFLAYPEKSPQFGMTKGGDAKRLKIFNQIQTLKGEANAYHQADQPAKESFLEMGRHNNLLGKTLENEKLPETPAGRQQVIDKLLKDAAGRDLPPEEQLRALQQAMDALEKRQTALNAAHDFLRNEATQASNPAHWSDATRADLGDKTRELRASLLDKIEKESRDINERRDMLEREVNNLNIIPPAPPPPPLAQPAAAAGQPAVAQPGQPAVAQQPAAQPAAAQPGQPVAQPPAGQAPPAPNAPPLDPKQDLLDRFTNMGAGMNRYADLAGLKHTVEEVGKVMEHAQGRGLTPGQ